MGAKTIVRHFSAPADIYQLMNEASGKELILFAMFMNSLAISTLLMLPAVVVGRIASRGGSRRGGDVAMAVFASYCVGQFMPLFY